MFKKNKRKTKNSADTLMEKELTREDIMQQRLKHTEDRKIAQMEKIEQKKQMLLEKQLKKQQEKEFILQTKLALQDEKNIRKQSNVNLHVLNKSNNNYVDKLAYVQSALDNNLLRLDRENNVINTVEQHKESVEKEIERIEQERQKELEDNNTIQTILLQKKQTIQTALDELSDLSIKTNTEYDKLQENKNVKQFELDQAEIKLSLLRKFA
jgi:hypothetical protein